MRVAFDFVCDEAPLFALVGKQLEKVGHEVSGITLGRRWEEFWRGYLTRPILADPSLLTVDDELARIRQDYPELDGGILPSDRFLSNCSREDQHRLLIDTVLAAEAFFRKIRPDVFFCTGVAYLYNLVTHAVCNKLGIPHIALYPTRGGEPRFTCSLGVRGEWDLVTEHYARLMSLDEAQFEISTADAHVTLSQFSESFTQPFYMKAKRQSLKLEPAFVAEYFTRCRRYYLEGWRSGRKDYITKSPHWYALRDGRKLLQAKAVSIARCMVFDTIDSNEQYYLFPLHLQPEASTLVHAQWYVNQLETIRNVAKCLPLGEVLFVKEHISALGRRSFAFYRELRSIHNVRLISPWENTKELIRKSLGVIVLTSTMGWEAILLGKPTYVLGDVFYNAISPCIRVASYEMLKVAVRERRPPIDARNRIAFIQAMHEGSYPGTFDVAKMDMAKKVTSADNIQLVAKGLTSILERLGPAQ